MPLTLQVVAPLLHPATLHVDMRAAVLLHGPSGSGKRTAARAAASALGLHFIHVSCHDLKVGGSVTYHCTHHTRVCMSCLGCVHCLKCNCSAKLSCAQMYATWNIGLEHVCITRAQTTIFSLAAGRRVSL